LSKETARLSTKGHILHPKSIRDTRAWAPGTEYAVEETREGVLLLPVRQFPRTTLDQLVGVLKYKGRPKTVEEMDEGIAREIRRRHARGRY
jgi:bifunctional DNA-binding transcriptional regulator/antitoxin component of YhaV-PrlF toxin-antitoxin module